MGRAFRALRATSWRRGAAMGRAAVLAGLWLLATATIASPAAARAAEPAAQRSDQLSAAALAASDARRFDKGFLSQLARQRETDFRRTAATLIGGLGNSRGIGILGRLARDARPSVREAVAMAAGRLLPLVSLSGKDQKSLETLLRRLLADRDPRVRRAAAWGIGASGLASTGRLLVERLRDEVDSTVRAALLQELWRARVADWIGVAAAALTDVSPEVRFAAAWSLARSEASSAAQPLRQAVRDPDPRVRTVALEGAGRGRGEALWDELCAAVEDQNPRVKIAALASLAATIEVTPGCRLPEAVAARIVAMAELEDPNLVHLRVAAIRAAGAAGVGQETLERIAGSGEPWFAAEALIALARQGAPDSDATIEAWLGSEDAEARRAAVPALRFHPNGTALLEQSLADPSSSVRLAALEAVGSARLGGLLEVVRLRLGDDDAVVRAAAVGCLAQLGAPLKPEEAIALLAGESTDGPSDAAVAFLDVLAEEPSFPKETRKVLEREMASREPVRARAAWDALRRHGVDDPPPTVATGEGPQFYREVLQWAAKPRWLEVVTVRGTMVILLDTEHAPLSGFKLSRLAEEEFFDGLTFHRVVGNFVVQGGDPRGDGWGGPGFAMRDEHCLLPYDPGATGLALSGPDTAGSQLFVALTERPHLTGRYPRIGEVVAGLETARRLRRGDLILRVRAGEGQLPTFYPVLYGELDPAVLDSVVPHWREERDGYTPDAGQIERLSSATLRYGLVVAMGTWCSDSREQVPRLEAILASLGDRSPFSKPELIGGDRSKTYRESLYPFGPVDRVPTISVTLDGTEIGRIVETPSSGSLESDLVRILAPIEGWEPPLS